MSASHTSYYKLGLAGLALLRNWLKGENDISIKLMSEAKTLIDNYSVSLRSVDSQVPEFKIQDGYAAWATNYDQMPNILLDAEQPVIENFLETLPKGKVVDMACGTGRYTTLLKELGHDVVGIDQSESMLEIARDKNIDIPYLQLDISKTNLNDDVFDALVCALALSHFETLDSPVAEFARVVKKGGTIILSDIHPMIVEMGGHADFFTKDGKRGFVENHTHWHSEYIKVFTENNLKIVSCFEPKLSWKQVKILQKIFKLEDLTIKKALLDLPIALIWVLKKS